MCLPERERALQIVCTEHPDVSSVFLWPNEINHLYCADPPLLVFACSDTYIKEIAMFVEPHCLLKLEYILQGIKQKCWGFPGGAVVENLPANAGDTGSRPGLGRSHMPRSSWAREPQLLSLSVWSLCSATGEAAIVRGPRTAMRSGPHSPQLEKALAQKRRPNTAINKNNK